MKSINLTEIIKIGAFRPGLTVGIKKNEIEQLLNQPLIDASIVTSDLDSFYVDIQFGLVLNLLFDKENTCFEINLNLDDNKDVNFLVKSDQDINKINDTFCFNKLIESICQSGVEWSFDNKRTYLQTVCIRLTHGLRLFYAFGSKSQNDYGLFCIKSILEGHRLTTLK